MITFNAPVKIFRKLIQDEEQSKDDYDFLLHLELIYDIINTVIAENI